MGVDENGSGDPSGDTIASWSSQGTTQDGLQKPDVYAPGAHIVSVLAPNSDFATSCPTCVVGNGQYIQTSGTSMAAPMISGLVADLLQIHPNWTPDQVKGDLTSSAATENSSFQEPNAVKAALLWNPPVADQGLTPSTPGQRRHREHQLQPVELEPGDLEPCQGPAPRRLRTLELELRQLLRDLRSGCRPEPRELEPRLVVDGSAAGLTKLGARGATGAIGWAKGR